MIMTVAPHGIIPFGGLAAASCIKNEEGYAPTATADVVRRIPILRHVLGFLHSISADKKSIASHLNKGSNVFLYQGGIAELFLSNSEKEQIYWKNRKGGVKLAMECGADLLPVYIFGNTIMLSMSAGGLLAKISTLMRVSLTVFWGRWGLPVPRRVKVHFVVGNRIKLPHVKTPTPQQVDEYHAKLIEAIANLYKKYQHKNINYRDKPLEII
eukprot:GHVL01030565.1.p1 GENE.GHVL01030565.1~~GHVL01030565.1.p1  ORF type:complete len:212 (+),score=32.29 GHVL01030565.1:400-1035(+)